MKKAVSTYHIIGGGVSGLCAAKFLRQKKPEARIILYEVAADLGGRCKSCFDSELATEIDTATHVILKANKNAVKLLPKNAKFEKVRFYDFSQKKLTANLFKAKDDIALAMFNMPLGKTAKSIIKTVFWKLFPFSRHKLRAYFSHNDLSSCLIANLRSYPSEIKTNWKLKSYIEENSRLKTLIFNKDDIDLADNDVVISAVDADNFGKIFDETEFEYNEIINIHYRTSMAITLPEKLSFIGVLRAQAQWIFSNKGVLSVTISDAQNYTEDNAETARKIWKEICDIRGHEAAFVPPFKVIRHKRATLKQDEHNNNLRPKNAKTKWSNLFLCGDWTMKDWPCSIESSVLSAKRVVKEIK